VSALVWAAASAVVCLAAVAAGAALGAAYDHLAAAVRPYIRPTGAHRR
jgi:hypothetical protein